MVAQRKPRPDGERPPPCCIILRVTLSIAAMVGVHRVAQAVAPGQQAGGHQRAAVAKACSAQHQASKFAAITAPDPRRGCWRKLSLSWLYSLSLPAGGGDHRLTIGGAPSPAGNCCANSRVKSAR